MNLSRQEQVWLEEAFAEIRKSAGLRYLFVSLFEGGGMYHSAPRDNDLLPRFEGQRDVLLDLKSNFDRHDPLLYLELQLERAQFLLNAEGGDGYDDGG